MKRTKIIFQKITALLVAAIMAVSVQPAIEVRADGALLPAAEDLTPDYLVLGDSISTGYGLAATEKGFADIVTSTLGYEMTNKAIDGNTAAGIYAQLTNADTKETMDALIKDAEFITISCGGNDLMGALYAEVAAKYNAVADPDITAEDVPVIMSNNSDSRYFSVLIQANTVISSFSTTDSFSAALSSFRTNIGKVVDYIRSLNEDATVIVLTQYNPYISFGATNAIYLGIESGVQELNSVIKTEKTHGYIVADVYTEFSGSQSNLCNATLSPMNLDFHPNAAGHAAIAVVIKETICENCTEHKLVNGTCLYCRAERVSITDITISGISGGVKEMKVGESYEVKYTIAPDNYMFDGVVWQSENTQVATIDATSATIEAVGVGETTITATTFAGDATTSFKVKVVAEQEKEEQEPGDPNQPPTSNDPTNPEPPKTPTEDTEIKEEIKTAPSKGAILTDSAKKAKYKVTKSGRKNGTVSYVKPINKKMKVITIPATVTIDGIKYKVTAIEKDAFKNNKNITKVTIGKNVSKIGKQAFYNCKNLKNIIINTKQLTKKTIGAKAFKGTSNSVEIKVPKTKMRVYKTILRAKGVSKKAKFRK